MKKCVGLLLSLILFGQVAVTSTVFAAQRCTAVQLDPSDEQAYNPDPICTPGAIDPAVTQENIFETVCKSGYTKTVRPPTSYTNKLKKQQIEEYGYADTNMKQYEEDHQISLELGGHPSDPKNLWPEPHASINEKDTVENYLHRQLCSGKMTLSQVQDLINHHWYDVFLELHPKTVQNTDLKDLVNLELQRLIEQLQTFFAILFVR